MTAIGVVVAGPDRAMVWADTMTLRGGKPSRHVPKLTTNATAAIAGAGTGWCNLIAEADRAVMQATDLGELLAALPGLLRHRAAHLAQRRGDPETFTGNAYVAAGWCPRWRRVMAYAFEAAAFFAPRPVTTWCAPDVPDLAAMGAASFADLEGVLVEQVAALERAHGCTVTGKIIGAEVGPGEVATRVLRDLSECATADQQRGATLEGLHHGR